MYVKHPYWSGRQGTQKSEASGSHALRHRHLGPPALRGRGDFWSGAALLCMSCEAEELPEDPRAVRSTTGS